MTTDGKSFVPQEPPISLVGATACFLQLPPTTQSQQWGYVMDRKCLLGHVPLSPPLAFLVPLPGALVNVTLVRESFDYTALRAQWSSHCVVYQLYGHSTARLDVRSGRMRSYPLKFGSVHYLPAEVFACSKLTFSSVTTGSLTLLLTVLKPRALQRLFRTVEGPVHGPLHTLQEALRSLQDLQDALDRDGVTVHDIPAGFDFLTANVQHTVQTKLVALRQLLQFRKSVPSILRTRLFFRLTATPLAFPFGFYLRYPIPATPRHELGSTWEPAAARFSHATLPRAAEPYNLSLPRPPPQRINPLSQS